MFQCCCLLCRAIEVVPTFDLVDETLRVGLTFESVEVLTLDKCIY